MKYKQEYLKLKDDLNKLRPSDEPRVTFPQVAEMIRLLKFHYPEYEVHFEAKLKKDVNL